MTAEVPALVRRARSAQAAWGARPVEERAEVLAAMRRWIVANRTAIVESTMRETGKTYEDALFNEVFVLADAIRSGSARRRAICATNASARAARWCGAASSLSVGARTASSG